MQALQAKCRVGIPRTHLVFARAFRRAGWILNRFHVRSGTGMTPHEFCTGTPYQGMLCECGESLLCHVISTNPNTRKSDAHWSKGVFLGKSDNDLCLTWRPQGLLACNLVKRCSEHFDPKAVMSVGIHPWEVKPITLAIRVVPRKSLPAPGTVAPRIAGGQEESAIPREGLVTHLPIAAGSPAVQSGTPGRLPGTPGRPRGPMQAQQPQLTQNRQCRTGRC